VLRCEYIACLVYLVLLPLCFTVDRALPSPVFSFAVSGGPPVVFHRIVATATNLYAVKNCGKYKVVQI
jgi:hypothetical protein